MARTVLDCFRLGPTTLTAAGGLQTLGSVPMATLVAGMSNDTLGYVDVVVALFSGDTSSVYATLFTLTAAFMLTTGPTYTLGTVSLVELNVATSSSEASDYYYSATLDINSGNLRVRITPVTWDLSSFAVVSTLTP